jgi:hypothetical protein
MYNDQINWRCHVTALATHGNLGPFDPNHRLDPEINQMVSAQIDDLVKYQVVQFLHRHPAAVGDASFFATALGFHSAEITENSLDELATCGILNREPCQNNGRSMYGLASDPDTRKRITRLCNLSNKAAVYDELLTLLAGRSLERAAKRAKTRPMGNRSQHVQSRPEP